MTVRELIDKLQQFPDDCKVAYYTQGGLSGLRSIEDCSKNPKEIVVLTSFNQKDRM